MKLARDPRGLQGGAKRWRVESVGNAGTVSLRALQATLKSFSVEEFISKDLFSFCMGDRVKGNKTGGRELLIHDANAMDCV